MCFFVCGVVVSPEFYVYTRYTIYSLVWFRWGNLDWGVCPYAWARAFIFFHVFFFLEFEPGEEALAQAHASRLLPHMQGIYIFLHFRLKCARSAFWRGFEHKPYVTCSTVC